MNKNELINFRDELIANLNDNILPYWLDKMEDERGGFYGRRDGSDRLDEDAPKGAILNARILWSFSAAYIETSNPAYLEAATRVRDYIVEHFIDRDFGGAYWSVDAEGKPLDTKKQFYAIAFIIYGLSEYYRATSDADSLSLAVELFDSIEMHSRDRVDNGYIEAANRDWSPIADMRLSEHDANASKTMNTHLHILEGYTNLLRALREHCPAGFESKVSVVEEATVNLLEIFLDRIENPKTAHLTLFFDNSWHKLDDAESYGHDIEASWLLLETALVVGQAALTEKTIRQTGRIADAALQGLCWDGSMIYERHADGRYDNDKHWWVQAENVIGQLWLAQYHGRPSAADAALRTWRFIADNIVDREGGEWHWSLKADGTINRSDDKAGFWKCPYHNSRMCLEAARSINALLERME